MALEEGFYMGQVYTYKTNIYLDRAIYVSVAKSPVWFKELNTKYTTYAHIAGATGHERSPE